MRIAAIALALSVAACGGSSLSQFMNDCGYNAKPFVAAWPCVRSEMVKAKGPGDLKDVYIASGDFVAEQVTAGKMTDAEAKLAMAQVRQKVNEADENRGNISPGNAIVASTILARPTAFPATQPLGTTRPALNCYRFGTSVQCY
jgi:hypothetical protein